MPITELPQPAVPNALLTFHGGALTGGIASSASATRANISNGEDGVAWWLPGAAGSPWLLGYGRFDITGGAGPDSLGAGILGAGDDTLRGGAGNDTISGAAAGLDMLDGGPGQDRLDWSWAGLSTALTVTMAQAVSGMTLGGTTFSGFESFGLTFGEGADVIDLRNFQAPAGSSFAGGGGDDLFVLDHMTGSVSIIDGTGIDRVRIDLSALTADVMGVVPSGSFSNPRFATHSEGARLVFQDTKILLGNFAIGPAQLGLMRYVVTDVPELVELRLGQGADNVDLSPAMDGNLAAASIDGGAGNDTLGGTAGDDVLDGGAGIDTLLVQLRGDVVLRLGQSGPQDTGFGHDIIGGFENVAVRPVGGIPTIIGDAQANQIEAAWGTLRANGMAGHDTLLGHDANDSLSGGTGDDSLDGRAGHDLLAGGPGSNSVTGGAGSDTLVIDGARHSGSLSITGAAPILTGLSGFSPSIFGTYAGPRETTAFSGIETLIFTDGRLAFDPGDPAMQVARLYETALNRAPNPYELNFWIDRLAEGMTLTRAGDIFAGGAEFAQVWGGLSNAAFISRLYANSVERAPNSFEASFWATQLNGGMSRGDVLTRLSEYHEARGVIGVGYANGIWDQDGASASIARLYQATLNRRPEEAGLRDWRAEMAAGKSLAELVPGFTNSAEFTTLYGATSNQAFVTLLYNNVLGRAPDAAGFAGWVAQLDAGGTRTDVVLGFSESLEFRLSTMSWIEGGIVFA